MDPLSLLFTAVVSGAAAALKPTAEKAVVDGYEALKALIKRKWAHVDVAVLERDPASEPRQQILKQDLEAAGGIDDRDLLEQAKALLKAIANHDPDAAQAANIDISDIVAGADANIDDVIAEGQVSIRGVKAAKDVNIRGVRAGNPTRR
jgi:hypothetical protein